MKKRFTHIGVGVAALSALVAQGKDFSREKLNAMLDELAASPAPETLRGPLAMCYDMALPKSERFEYVCKKCAVHTVYPTSVWKMKSMSSMLSKFREQASGLKSLGLDITLDESALCSKCHLPTEEGWVSAEYISEDGKIKGPEVNVRERPDSRSEVICSVNDTSFTRLPARPGDPASWVRVRLDRVARPCNIAKLAWVINGKRTIVENDDATILRAFLTGQKKWEGFFSEEHSVKNSLPRLRELLGVGTSKGSK